MNEDAAFALVIVVAEGTWKLVDLNFTFDGGNNIYLFLFIFVLP